MFQVFNQLGGQLRVFQLQRITKMPVSGIGHVLHTGHIEIAVEVLLQLRGDVAQVHVAVESHIGNVGGDDGQRTVGILHDSAVE